ncbi:hypothetical protein [Gordonia sp. KTR9]|uniref:hypothetical protein n=1 Tax=Gordonia sp. KTR9 TaxID=337191 RepID=UPI0005CA35F9|nr:hypothetical protein [Gordonia sp. KTR9]
MRKPSWVELAGRNAAAESVYVAGTLTVRESPGGEIVFDFQHAPGGRWRVERAGRPIYLANGRSSVVRVDDHMQQLDGDIRMALLGARFSPLDLLGPDSLLHRMSAGLAADATSPEDIGGRPGWSVRLVGAGAGAVVLVFDDSTGLLVRVANDRGDVLLQVDNLAEPETLPDALFVWDGPIRPAPSPRDRRRNTADDDTERLEYMRAVVAAQARPHEVLAAVTAADGEASARAAVIRLLGVTEFGADAIMATPIGRFRGDHTAADRRTFEVLEERRRY